MKTSGKGSAKKLLCVVLALITMLSVVSGAFAADTGMNGNSGDSFSFMIGGDGVNGAKVVCNYCQGIRATLLDAVTGVAVPSKRGGNTSFDIAGAHAYNGAGEGMMGFMGNGISTSLSKYDYLYGDFAYLGITETSDMEVRFQQWRKLFNENTDQFPHIRDAWDSLGYETNNNNNSLASWDPSGKITTNSQFTNTYGPDGGWTDGQTGNTLINGTNNKAAMPVVINDAAGAKRVNINAVKNYFTAKYAEDGSIFEDPEKNDPVIFILAQYWALVGTGNESKLDNYKEFISGKYDLLIEPITDYYNAWKGGYMILTATDIAVMGFYEDTKSTSTTEFLYNIPNSAILEYEEVYSSAVYSTCETNEVDGGTENGGWAKYANADIFYNMGMWIVHFAGDTKDNVKVLCFDKSKALPGDDTTGLIASGSIRMEGGSIKPENLTNYNNEIASYIKNSGGKSETASWFFDGTKKSLANTAVSEKMIPGTLADTRTAREKAISALKKASIESPSYASIKLSDVPTMEGLKLQPDVKPGLEGYSFEFALGEDLISDKNQNAAFLYGIAENDDSQTVTMVATHGTTQPVLRLYYGETNHYKVRVRVNGEIDPPRDQDFPAPTGDVIEEKDVDKSKVPDGATITGIEGVPLTIDPDPEKNVIIIDCIVPGYTVKVRVNGVIIPELNRFYPAKVGDVIQESDVDTSIVPKEFTITGIDNVPLTIDEDSEKNIIIINAESDKYVYTIEYYLDGVFAESEKVPASIGDVITNPAVKGFPGYKLDKINGTPLTIVDSRGVIRVYYSKIVPAAAADPAAKIYADEYKTPIPSAARPTEKSGYGVYSLFFVDMSSYLSAYENPQWSVPAGCSASPMSKTVPTYQTAGGGQITPANAVVTATWMEGTKIVGGKPKLDENGHKVTVQMEYDAAHSTATVWAFRLPENPGSGQKLHKAYIPVNTPDGQNKWGISYSFSLSCNVYSWNTTAVPAQCGGHTYWDAYPVSVPDGNGGYTTAWYPYSWTEYHRYTYYSLNEHLTPTTITKSATASLSIKGNMYEDDFTGDRK